MTSPGPAPHSPSSTVFDVERQTRVIAVIDVVGSVRLMEQDEIRFIGHWRSLVRRILAEVLPPTGGQLHKSLGDGLMLAFDSAPQAVEAAFAIHALCAEANQDVPAEHHLRVRCGLHLASFVADEHDIYGSDVNLAARIATLAGPGETVASAALHDRLVDGLDAGMEDLGDCHLKHVEEPVRAYRIGPAGDAPVVPPRDGPEDFRPTIAVIPFEARSAEPEHQVIGELIADGVIAQLSRSAELRVISRLSTTAFRGRHPTLSQVESQLAAGFVLSGSYHVSGARILLLAQLAETRTGTVVWAERISGDTMDLLQAQSALLNQLAAAASKALIDAEVQRSLTLPLPRLDSCSLLLGGISHMHRSSVNDFHRSRAVLEALQERHNRAATPRAWLGKWHIMRVVRGISDAPQKDAQLAIEHTQRALDLEPDSPLSLAVQGHALCQLAGDADGALERIDRAIRLNPNESLAWLYKSVWSSMWGSSEACVDEALIASALSPVDPLRYYFDTILAAGYSIHRDYDKATEYALRALRANKYHQPTIRVLLHAQVESGQMEAARETLALLLRDVPHLTVSGYLAMGSAESPSRQRLAAALRQLGVPER